MKKVLIVLIAGLTVAGYSQNSNVSSAGIAYKNHLKAKMGGDIEDAAKELADAKEFIDEAYVHEKTKDDPKMLMYYGKIYIDIPAIAVASGNIELSQVDKEKAFEDGFAALKRSKEVDERERYVDEVNDYCNLYHAQLVNMGNKMYQEEKFAEASQALLAASKFKEVTGTLDSMALFYGALAAYQVDSLSWAVEGFKECVKIEYKTGNAVYYWSQALQKQEKFDEAEKMLKEQVAKYPDDKDILIELINLYIAIDQKEEAAKVLKAAIDLDPENEVLVYTSGTIYENLDRFEDAEAAYKKCLEINEKNVDAAFALGGLYFNKGADLNNEANKLPLGDPKYEKMTADSKDYFAKAIPYLEMAHKNAPKDVVVMKSLKDAYGKAGMTDKFMEMKKKIEAANSGGGEGGQ